MAKNFEHIIHRHSNETTNGQAKLPTASQIEFGEIAINYSKGNETISIKNDNNEIVKFNPDSIKRDEFEEVELVIASALDQIDKNANDLNSKIDNVDAKIDNVDAKIDNEIEGVVNEIIDDEKVLSAAISDIGTRVNNMISLPSVSSSDNGKILMVINGVWSLTSPVTVYTGGGMPDSAQGNNGDIYIQTS